jgi:hypothetical protein
MSTQIFIKEIRSDLLSVDCEDSLIEFVNVVLSNSKLIVELNNTKQKNEIKDILLLIRKKVLDLLAVDILPHRCLISLNFIFELYPLDENQQISGIISSLSSDLTNNKNITELFVHYELICIFSMLNCKKDGYFIEYLLTLIENKAIYDEHSINVSSADIKIMLNQQNFDEKWLTTTMEKLLDYNKFKKLTSKRHVAIFKFITTYIWNIKNFYVSKYWYSCYDIFLNFTRSLVENEDLDNCLLFDFIFSHIIMNIMHTNEEFKKLTDDFEILTSKFYQNYGNKFGFRKPKVTKKSKKVIAIVQERLIYNSVFQVVYSLLESLQKDKNFTDKYKIIFVSLGYIEKGEDQKSLINAYEDINIDVYNTNSALDEELDIVTHITRALSTRDLLIDKEVDIMLAATNNYPIINFLFSTRVAPLQIFWSHGNFAWDVIGIDKRVSHFNIPTKFKYDLIYFDMNMMFLNGEANMESVKNIRNQFPKNSLILGTIGRLTKLTNSDYIDIINRVLNKYKNTIYIACGTIESSIEEIKQKLDKKISNRVYFVGHINPHEFGHIIDIFMDSFPLKQGNSMWEFVAKNGGKPIISLDEADAFKNILQESKYKNIDEIFVQNIDEYNKKLFKLVESKEYREEVGKNCYKFLTIKNSNVTKKFISLLN